MNVEECGILSVHDGLLDVAWFCVFKLGGSLAGVNISFVGWLVKVRVRWETDGFVWKLSDSCQQHTLRQFDTYVRG